MDLALLDVKFWAGTEESLAAYMAVARSMLQAVDATPVAGRMQDQDSEATEPERMSRLLSKSGDLGIVKIAGPLNNTDSWMNEYRGMTGYPEIRDALIQAAVDPSVKAIVLDINSGGGAVSGVFDTGNLIRRIDKDLKPVHSFSDGVVASAAYLLAASARTVNIGPMTEAGSIGVLSVHQEMSKMLAEAGINVKVLRAGKYKALGNSFEPLGKLAEEEIQGQLDHMYGVFASYMADRRRASAADVDKMAQGRIFIGSQAKDVGLVDDVTSFDALASKVQRGIDAKKSASQYAPNLKQGSLVTQALTEQQIAALAEGGAAQLSPEERAAAEAADKAAADKAAADAAAKQAADKATAEAAAKQPSTDAVVALLQSQLKDTQAQVTDLTIQLRDEKSKGEAVVASHGAMREIAVASVSRLRIALGHTALTPEAAKALGDEQLLAEHTSLRTQFEGKFKAGGVAAVSTTNDNDNKPVGDEVDSAKAARLKATRP